MVLTVGTKVFLWQEDQGVIRSGTLTAITEEYYVTIDNQGPYYSAFVALDTPENVKLVNAHVAKRAHWKKEEPNVYEILSKLRR